MQHQLSNSNVSTTIGRVKSSPTDNLARPARFAETEATRDMQFKQARNIRLVETALRAAAQGCAPQASSGNRHGDRQLSTGTLSSGAKRFTKSRIVAVISLALVLPTLGVAGWLGVTPLADMSQQSPFIPSPVLTAPALLEATADESIFVPIALDGTDGVPAHSSIAVTGLPQGSTLSKGQPFGDTGWKLERDEIADLQLVVPNTASGQAKLTIQLIAPDGTLVADAEILLQIATASQDSLPRNAEDIDAAQAPANREPTLLGAGMAWNDTANVCGEATQAAEERPEPPVAQPMSKSELADSFIQPLTRHECDKAGMTWNDTTNVCDEKSLDSATQTGPKETNPVASTLLINIEKASQKMTVFLDGVQQYE